MVVLYWLSTGLRQLLSVGWNGQGNPTDISSTLRILRCPTTIAQPRVIRLGQRPPRKCSVIIYDWRVWWILHLLAKSKLSQERACQNRLRNRMLSRAIADGAWAADPLTESMFEECIRSRYAPHRSPSLSIVAKIV
jgi:hypothetical protein